MLSVSGFRNVVSNKFLEANTHSLEKYSHSSFCSSRILLLFPSFLCQITRWVIHPCSCLLRSSEPSQVGLPSSLPCWIFSDFALSVFILLALSLASGIADLFLPSIKCLTWCLIFQNPGTCNTDHSVLQTASYLPGSILLFFLSYRISQFHLSTWLPKIKFSLSRLSWGWGRTGQCDRSKSGAHSC